MKHLITIVLALSLWACSVGKKAAIAPYKNFDIPLEMKYFLADFEKNTLQHKEEKVLTLMNEHYKTEQHDGMLGGRTTQFLNEFFCGYQVKDDKFKCLTFSRINKMEIQEVTSVSDDYYSVTYHVIQGETTIKASWGITAVTANGKTTYGLVGGSGKK